MDYAEPKRTVDMVLALSPAKEPENIVLRVLEERPYRPVPGKLTVEMVHNRIVKVVGYGTDASGEYVEVRALGSYRARHRLPLSCIRRLTEQEHLEASDLCRLEEP